MCVVSQPLSSMGRLLHFSASQTHWCVTKRHGSWQVDTSRNESRKQPNACAQTLLRLGNTPLLAGAPPPLRSSQCMRVHASLPHLSCFLLPCHSRPLMQVFTSSTAHMTLIITAPPYYKQLMWFHISRTTKTASGGTLAPVSYTHLTLPTIYSV